MSSPFYVPEDEKVDCFLKYQRTETQYNLLSQVIEHPEEYERKLIYADALEETGYDDAVRTAQAIRSRRWTWNQPSYHGFATRSGTVNCAVGGYIEMVRCTMDQWIEFGKHYCAFNPILRVRITDKTPRFTTIEPYDPSVYGSYPEPIREWVRQFDDGFKFDGIRSGWFWQSAETFYQHSNYTPLSHNYMDCVLPSKIFELISTEGAMFSHPDNRTNGYLTLRAAHLALSSACIQWAKSENS